MRRNPGRFERLESRLWELRDGLEQLRLNAPPGRETAYIRAARGLDRAFKSQVLAERMRAALWKLVQWEGLQGDHIVLPTETSGHLPDLESFLTESTFLQLHSASDLLAQVLNQALLAKPLAPDECSLAAIREQLAPGLEYSALIAAVDKLRGSADYAYVAGFANYCKHQGYVEREHVSEYRSDSIPSGTALHSFSYRKKQFPAKTYRQLDLMTGRLHKLYLAVVRAAIELTE